MNNYLEERLNPYETIQKYLPDIIDTFNEFYKEDVSEKFQNMTVICTRTPEGLERYLKEIKENYTNHLIKSFCTKFNIKYNKTNINNIFGISKLPFENINNIPIMKYEKLKDIYNFNIKEVIEYIKKLNFKYHKYLEKYFKYFNYIEESKKLKKEIDKKYMNKLVLEFKENFPKEELDLYFKTGFLKGKMYNYLGSNIHMTPLISAFNKESEEILNDIHSKKWKKDMIKKDRIDFFKKMGLFLDGNYHDYMNCQKAISLIPPKDLIEDILDAKEECELKIYQEYYESLKEYKINKERLNKENLLLDDGYNINTFLYSDTYVTPNIKKINDKYIVHSMVNINFDYPNEYLDKYIIHELNHAYEANLIGSNVSSGWDIFYDENGKLNRKYKYFNEIINDLIADDITNMLHQKGIYMFYPKNKAKVNGGTNYESFKFLVKDFYNIFKEDIIKSRRGNFNHILNKCGKENFDKLNDLINLFNDTWKGLEILNLKFDLKNNKDTLNTKKYKEILIKLNQILNNMIQYKEETEEKSNDRRTRRFRRK